MRTRILSIKIKKYKYWKITFQSFFSIILILLLVVFYQQKNAKAAPLTSISDVMTRLQVSPATSSHDITFTLGGSTALDAGETITVDFGEDDSKFTVDGSGSLVADFDFNDGTERTIVDVDGSCAGHSGSNDIVVGINDSTGVLTLTACGSSTSSSSGATVNIEYGTAAGGTNRVTNPTASNDYVVNIAGTVGDTGSFAVAIIDDDTVTVTASVDPSITFVLSATTTDFGTISPGVIDTAGTNITLTVGTNAASGYSITVRDAGSGSNPGLYDSETTSLIGSADASYNDTADLSSVSLGYGLQASCAAGCTTNTHVASRWRQGSDTVGGLEITDTAMVTYSSVMSAEHTVQVVHKAKVATYTPAGSYNDSITYIATGNF